MRRLVVLLLVAAAVGGCGGGGGERAETPRSATGTALTAATTAADAGRATVTTSGRYRYPHNLTKAFMRSCTGSPQANRAYCACALDKLSHTMPLAEFERIGRLKRIPPASREKMQRAVKACRDEL